MLVYWVKVFISGVNSLGSILVPVLLLLFVTWLFWPIILFDFQVELYSNFYLLTTKCKATRTLSTYERLQAKKSRPQMAAWKMDPRGRSCSCRCSCHRCPRSDKTRNEQLSLKSAPSLFFSAVTPLNKDQLAAAAVTSIFLNARLCRYFAEVFICYFTTK